MKYLLVVISIIVASAAQVLVKKASYSDFPEKSWLVYILAALMSYGVAFSLQSYILKFLPLSKIAPVTGIAIVILVFVCGIWLFHETATTKQIAGIVLGVISIYLILG